MKMKQTGGNAGPGIGTENPAAATSGIIQNPTTQLQTKSPSPTGEDSRRNRPIVAKLNFVIAQKGALGQNYRGPYDESVFERNKEVDEWLIGSGESIATAGSNNDHHKAQVLASAVQVKQKRNSSIASMKQNELEKPVQPGLVMNNNNLSSEEEDCCEEEEDDEVEDWMFQTFTGGKKALPMPSQINKDKTSATNGRQNEDARGSAPNLNRNMKQHDLDGGLGSSYEESSNSSPFDLPSDIMSKQFSMLGRAPQPSPHQ